MSMPALSLCENAHRVLEARYLRRDAHGTISETPEQLFARVARAIAHAELVLGNAAQAAFWEEQFYTLLASLDFLPNSPTLMNAGTPLGQEDPAQAISPFLHVRDIGEYHIDATLLFLWKLYPNIHQDDIAPILNHRRMLANFPYTPQRNDTEGPFTGLSCPLGGASWPRVILSGHDASSLLMCHRAVFTETRTLALL